MYMEKATGCLLPCQAEVLKIYGPRRLFLRDTVELTVDDVPVGG